MRLIDIEKLRGCAIIRPRNSTEIKVIESFADKIKHQDIPTAFDLDHALNQLEEELRLSEEEKQKVNSLQFDQVKGRTACAAYLSTALAKTLSFIQQMRNTAYSVWM